MQIVELTGDTRPEGGCVALGAFDGVHIGHRRILSAAKSKSTELSTVTSVLLFSSAPHGAPELLPMADRLDLFREAGVDRAYIFPFPALKDLSAKDFVHTVLAKTLHAKAVFAGFNYHFGAHAAGNAELLQRFSAEVGMGCAILPAVEMGGAPVSSTRIRALLAAGDVETANSLLAYPYFLHTAVEHGKELGRTLGLPTVNQSFGGSAAPMAHGVYDTLTVIDGVRYPSVTNVGLRPTVGGGTVNAETHILDFDGDLYGQSVKVEFYKMERGERKFADVESLKRQIETDCVCARAYFAERSELLK